MMESMGRALMESGLINSILLVAVVMWAIICALAVMILWAEVDELRWELEEKARSLHAAELRADMNQHVFCRLLERRGREEQAKEQEQALDLELLEFPRSEGLFVRSSGHIEGIKEVQTA